MKKILFLLLTTVTFYGQTLQNPTYGTVKIKNNTTSTTATKVNVQENDGTINTKPLSELANYLEFASAVNLPVTGVAGKIYATKDTNKIYRWNGTFYSEFVGAKGEKGDQGIQGIQGVAGLTGLKGDKGDVGLTGSIGLTGAKGDKGDQGIQGFKGDTGLTGADGAMGSQGPQGIQGIQGETGLRGIQGEIGPQGPIGFTGAKGADGTGVSIKGSFDNTSQLPASGADGDAYLINGNLHVWNGTAWVNVGNIQGPQGLIGLTGATGSQGIQGAKGDKGDQGIQGVKGEKGDTGAKGDTGSFNGDITADQVTETATRKFQTPTQSAYNDATSSIQGQLNRKENAFSKNTAFNKPFGMTVGTVADGNDYRINNGQTAFGWGNHSSGGYAPINNPTFTGTVNGVTKSMVGLGNVDNTSDANKPVSTATQTALNGKENLKENTITVAKSGGQYLTIDSALSYAKIHSTQEDPITILVHSGRYNEFLQIPPDKYITIRGVDRESCILYDDSGDYYQAPISMAGNVAIENMTIIASNENISIPPPALPSYAIHHDSGGFGKSYIRNCNLISYNNAAIGIGTQNNQQLTIENCYMFSTANPALLMHPDPSVGSTNQKMVVRNCIMVSSTDKVIALIDSNNTGGGAGDNRDTELTFTNNTVFSTTTGLVDLFYGTAPMGSGDFGYMLLKDESLGNSVDFLNKVKLAVDTNVIHTTGNETKTGNLALAGNSAITAKIHAANGNGGDFRNLHGSHVNSRTYRTTTDVNAYGDWALQKEQTKGGNDFINVINVNQLGQIVATAPTAAPGTNTTQIATTAFVLAINENAVHKTGNEVIAGIKTFSSPILVPTAVNSNEAVNKGQLDAFVPSGTVNLTGVQTVSGVKTFSDALIGTTANFSGTVTVPNPINPFNAATKQYVDALATRPYKVYTALITQTGTSAPVATVLENTLGGTITWTRNGIGSYDATLSGAFANGKTYLSINNSGANNSNVTVTRITDNVLRVQSSDNSAVPFTASDAKLQGSSFEIRVYL